MEDFEEKLGKIVEIENDFSKLKSKLDFANQELNELRHEIHKLKSENSEMERELS